VSATQKGHAANEPLNPIAQGVKKLDRIVVDETRCDVIVFAREDELIVHVDARGASSSFDQALRKVATLVGNLASIPPRPTQLVPCARQAGRHLAADYFPTANGPLSKVEVWRLNDPKASHSIEQSQHLRKHLADTRFRLSGDDEALLPGIHPHHVAILCPQPGGCPASPPEPAQGPDGPFVTPPSDERAARVTILDSGYIWVDLDHLDASHEHLDERVTVVQGQWLNTETGTWEPDEPDGLYTNLARQLDGISGHGTFIAGLISHIAPRTRLEVVGLRNQEVEIDGLAPGEQLGLFETEAAIAHMMLQRCDTDVIQCGFAFPTLDDYPSLPFAAVMAEIRMNAPNGKGVAVVAPAGNETSPAKYWPAALPDVIGVASSDPQGQTRSGFSNWGRWCDCCTGGEDVYSTFVHWDGSVEGTPPTKIVQFPGWATWNGTSFAAPKVSAAIATLFADGGAASPVDAANQLIRAAVKDVVDGGVDLPYLQIG
jgi:hypothetical protein